MIIWHGRGIIVLVIFIIVVVSVSTFTQSVLGLDRSFMDQPLYFSIISTISAALSYFASKTIARPTSRDLIDPQNNTPVKVVTNHSFFFISVQHWTFVFLGFAVFFLGKAIFEYFV
jgi:hypothetical protein